MRCEEAIRGRINILKLSGKIMGGEDISDFRQLIKKKIAVGERHFVIDLDRVEWANSMGLGMLVGTTVTIGNCNGRLKLANAGNIYSMFVRTRLTEVLDICESLEEAIAELEAEPFEA